VARVQRAVTEHQDTDPVDIPVVAFADNLDELDVALWRRRLDEDGELQRARICSDLVDCLRTFREEQPTFLPHDWIV